MKTITLMLLITINGALGIPFWNRLFTNDDVNSLKQSVADLSEYVQQFRQQTNEKLDALKEDTSKLKKALKIKKTVKNNVVDNAIQNGIDFLLDARGDDYSWFPRQNAEAILALRLGDLSEFSLTNLNFLLSVYAMKIELLSVLSSNPAMNDTTWGHGKLGQYVTALNSVCQDPRDFYGFNLLQILKNQFSSYKFFFKNQRFALSWIVLGLCTSGEPVGDDYLNILAENPGQFVFGKDEASMIVIALSCVNDSRFEAAQTAAETFIIDGRQNDGMFGNEYTTGLSIQALTRYSGSDANMGANILLSQDKLARNIIGKFTNVALANQVIPALASTSYADVKYMCPPQEATTVPTTTVPTGPQIKLQITVQDTIISSPPVDKSWNVTTNVGNTVYDALLKLQSEDSEFTFTSEVKSWGHSITSILNITPNSNLTQYWSFRKYPDTMMQTGVSNTQPTEDTHYLFKVATW